MFTPSSSSARPLPPPIPSITRADSSVSESRSRSGSASTSSSTITPATAHHSKTAEVLLRAKPQVLVSNKTGLFSSITNYFANRLGRQLGTAYDKHQARVEQLTGDIAFGTEKLKAATAQLDQLKLKLGVKEDRLTAQISPQEAATLKREIKDLKWNLKNNGLAKEITHFQKKLKSLAPKLAVAQKNLSKTEAAMEVRNLTIEQQNLQAEITTLKNEYKAAKKELKAQGAVAQKIREAEEALPAQKKLNVQTKGAMGMVKPKEPGWLAAIKLGGVDRRLKEREAEYKLGRLEDKLEAGEARAKSLEAQIDKADLIGEKLYPLLNRLLQLRQKANNNESTIKALKDPANLSGAASLKARVSTLSKAMPDLQAGSKEAQISLSVLDAKIKSLFPDRQKRVNMEL